MAEQNTAPAEAWQTRRKATKKRRLMAAVLFLLFCALLLVLSLTVLFRMDQVVVSGMENYDSAYVCRIAGLEQGDNLLRMRMTALQEQLLNNTLDADKVEVVRSLPSSLQVTFTPAVPTLSIKGSDGAYYCLSAGYRVIQAGDLAPTDGTIVLHGFTLTDEAITVGAFASFQENDLLALLREAINECGITNITAIDISDRNNIRLLYGQNLVIDLGDSTELSYKLGFIKDCMDKGRVDTVAIGCADAGETGKIYYRTLSDDPALSTTIAELLATEDIARKAQAENEAAAAAESGSDKPDSKDATPEDALAKE